VPLQICYIHLLTAAVVDASEHIDAVVVVLCAVQEASVRHGWQLVEVKCLQVKRHRVLCACAVVVAAKNNYLICRD